MNSLVIYESQYGNTEKIAVAISKNIQGAMCLQVNDVVHKDLEDIELLVVGSPTQGGRPMNGVKQFLEQLSPGRLNNVKVATFDTRLAEKDQVFAVRLLIKTIGYAAGKIAEGLKNRGGELIAAPEGFIVKGKEGPIADGEVERASKWGKMLWAKVKKDN